ncbi:hypothetical protein JW960_17230 [candidate division KSB1 bacterium]|nr:hypothetical protein [candidate division KSB1 bacterium]
MKKRLVIILGVGILLMNSVNNAQAKVNNDLANRFAEILQFRKDISYQNKVASTTKITSLFIRSSEDREIDLTVLVTHDDHITELIQRMLNEHVTPLIFSVSTMPFVETTFDPTAFVFEQGNKRWSPGDKNPENFVFPLGEDELFGGQMCEQDVHQGVIMLPMGFDLNKPVKVSYKNFKKMCRFK